MGYNHGNIMARLYISPLAQFIHIHLTNLSNKFGYKTRNRASSKSVDFSVYSETLWELNNYITHIKSKNIITKSFGLFHILKLLRQAFLNYKQFEISEYGYPDKPESPLSRHLSMANEIISYNRGWLYIWLLLLVIVFDVIFFIR